ncbi:acyl-CoA thioester hydrolase [Gillisia sp. Hel_I_86]|uniref:acyl-CoA thioesterase n=1 Tax=Gillisia sp. Hel_I_86 TaxID=1249981 RepID=UPI00119A2931|nr:thioesterase family protein [Gillisia sp. Hel_I_86]TVZ26603.1 acyl-CoA thioester hydrolase [Gillisia sp. Hel_I_86]
MDYSDYKLSIGLRIDWSDLDMYKHVNNLAFIRFMQTGRSLFWEATGLTKIFEESNKGPMVVSTHCDFKKSLYYPGTAIVKTKLAFIKNSSFGLDHIILNKAMEVCAEGRDVAVFYDFNTNKTYTIPDDLREIMKDY